MHGIGCGSTILGGRTTSLVTGCVARFLRESFIHQSAAPNHSLLGRRWRFWNVTCWNVTSEEPATQSST